MKNKAIPEVCKNCRFWSPVDSDDSKEEFGLCQRFPPTVVVYDEQASAVRPITEWKDHCGEFKLRIDA